MPSSSSADGITVRTGVGGKIMAQLTVDGSLAWLKTPKKPHKELPAIVAWSCCSASAVQQMPVDSPGSRERARARPRRAAVRVAWAGYRRRRIYRRCRYFQNLTPNLKIPRRQKPLWCSIEVDG